MYFFSKAFHLIPKTLQFKMLASSRQETCGSELWKEEIITPFICPHWAPSSSESAFYLKGKNALILGKQQYIGIH